MLLKDKLARYLNFTPRIRKLINNKESAIATNVETVKEQLIKEFLSLVNNVIEINIQNKIESLEQGFIEVLVTYYQKALRILKKTYNRDCLKDANTKSIALSSLEIIILNIIVNAFVKGLA